MHTYSFENLDVWKKSRTLVKKIYILTREFPPEEKYGLISQIRRAALSVTTNLSEGSSRKSFKDQARFTEIAYGSLLEVLNLLICSFDLGYIKEELLLNERPLIEGIGKQLNALQKAQLKRKE